MNVNGKIVWVEDGRALVALDAGFMPDAAHPNVAVAAFFVDFIPDNAIKANVVVEVPDVASVVVTTETIAATRKSPEFTRVRRNLSCEVSLTRVISVSRDTSAMFNAAHAAVA